MSQWPKGHMGGPALCVADECAGMTCDDTSPSFDYTCDQQKAFGRCDAPFMRGYCSATCGRCDATPDMQAPRPYPASRRLMQGVHFPDVLRPECPKASASSSLAGWWSEPYKYHSRVVCKHAAPARSQSNFSALGKSYHCKTCINSRFRVNCRHDIAPEGIREINSRGILPDSLDCTSLHCQHAMEHTVLDWAQAPAMIHPRAQTTAARSRRLSASVTLLSCRGIAMPPVAVAPLAPVSAASG